MDKNKQTTALIIIAVALIAALGYIGLDSYNERKAQEQLNVYQNGLTPAAHPRPLIAPDIVAVGCSAVLCRPSVPHLWARRDASKPGERP